MWSAVLRHIARKESPDRNLTLQHFRPYLLSTFPWHTPDEPHPEIRTADQWWVAMELVFQQAFGAVGFAPERAQATAQEVRHVYVDPNQ
jgi:hypothetical protein